MYEQAFEVASLERTDGGQWSVGGRAHLDVALGDVLETSVTGGGRVLVVGLATYGRTTDLLSKMMTGTLIVEGEIQEPLAALFAQR
ncbi:hypothetical protein [Vulgatibacter incomptus]|uniref:hypothetical protein n=1 Tax=Vulgatibacter incomptus TaxID=1391653 RepID=UPI0006807EE2|nr:hypothetical protein [Vulgatibacter incomptus]